MDKIRVQRANVILDISSDQKQRYMDQGYSVIDESGKILEEAMSNDVRTLQGKVRELQKLVAQKDAEIEKLKAPKTTKKAAEVKE